MGSRVVKVDHRVGKNKSKDLSNQRFGLLVAQCISKVERGNAYWLCRCDCGASKIARASLLISKNIQSCGCMNGGKEHVAKTRKGVSKYHVDNTKTYLLTEKPPKNNTSGRRGVSYNKQRKLWEAYIRINNKQIHLGYHCEYGEAVKAREAAEVKYFKPYTNAAERNTI